MKDLTKWKIPRMEQFLTERKIHRMEQLFKSKLLMPSTLSVLTCAAVQIFQNQEILFKIQHLSQFSPKHYFYSV